VTAGDEWVYIFLYIHLITGTQFPLFVLFKYLTRSFAGIFATVVIFNSAS